MDNEPFVQEQGWKKHFTTVTPLSKYLALALFVALPFIGFFLGVQYESVRITVYEPTIVERVFEKEVVVEKGSTTTPEVKIIIFSGIVREGGQSSCMVDGICSTVVSEYEVIWAEGWNSEPVGSKEVVYPGDAVEVFGRVVDENTVTLYGNENYYLKKDKNQPKIDEKNQGVEKILRGELMTYFEDGPGCETDAEGRRCFKEIILFTNNAWEYRDWYGTYDEGMLEKETVSQLITDVSSSDLGVLEDEELCASGEDVVGTYTFYTELGVVSLDECQIGKTNLPLFRETITTIFDSIYLQVES